MQLIQMFAVDMEHVLLLAFAFALLVTQDQTARKLTMVVLELTQLVLQFVPLTAFVLRPMCAYVNLVTFWKTAVRLVAWE